MAYGHTATSPYVVIHTARFEKEKKKEKTKHHIRNEMLRHLRYKMIRYHLRDEYHIFCVHIVDNSLSYHLSLFEIILPLPLPLFRFLIVVLFSLFAINTPS